jgi:hypothetical protein
MLSPNSLPNIMLHPKADYLSSVLRPLRLYSCRKSSTNRPFFVQTNPILSASGGFKTLYLTKTYEKNAKFSPTKTNPKRTQTNPNEPKTNAVFGPSAAPKAKTNPNKPNLSRRSRMRSRSKANLSRRSLLAAAKSSTKPGWLSPVGCCIL